MMTGRPACRPRTFARPKCENEALFSDFEKKNPHFQKMLLRLRMFNSNRICYSDESLYIHKTYMIIYYLRLSDMTKDSHIPDICLL